MHAPAITPSGFQGEAINEDRPCPKCEYNLRGLVYGGVCPECGEMIRRSRRYQRFADNLTDAPLGYIKRIAAGFGMMLLSLVGVVGFFILAPGIPAAAIMMLLMCALGWCLGCWIVLCRRPRNDDITPDPVLDHQPLRLAALWSQALWVVPPLLMSGIGFATGFRATFGNVVVGVLVGLSVVAAFASLIPLAAYLSAIADWAGESRLGGRLRAVAWVIAFIGAGTLVSGLAGLLPMGIANLFQFFTPIGMVLVGGALALFGISVFQLSLMSVWAVRNAADGLDRDARMAERKRRYEEDGVLPDEGDAHRPLPCAECGYDRTGLPVGAVCPECGSPPMFERAPDVLRASGPKPEKWDPQHEQRIPLAEGGEAGMEEPAGADGTDAEWAASRKIHHTPKSITAERRKG